MGSSDEMLAFDEFMKSVIANNGGEFVVRYSQALLSGNVAKILLVADGVIDRWRIRTYLRTWKAMDFPIPGEIVSLAVDPSGEILIKSINPNEPDHRD